MKIDEPWSFTRPDSSASGIFFFQYCGLVCCQTQTIFERGKWIKYTHLDGIAHDGLAVLYNKAKMRVMESEHQALRPNAASDIDNQ